MKGSLFLGVVVAATMLFASTANATLIWDTVTGDGTATTPGAGIWQDGGGLLWNDGVTPNVAWSNTGLDRDAQFEAQTSSATPVTVSGTVAPTSLTIAYPLGGTGTLGVYTLGGGTIQFDGTTPTIMLDASHFWVRETALKTVAGQTLTVNSTSATNGFVSTMYLYGDTPSQLAGTTVLGDGINEIMAVIRNQNSLSTGEFVVNEKSSLFIQNTYPTTADLTINHAISISGNGCVNGSHAGKGAIESYKLGTAGSNNIDTTFNGAITLADSATIGWVNSDIIFHGNISGDHELILKRNSESTWGNVENYVRFVGTVDVAKLRVGNLNTASASKAYYDVEGTFSADEIEIGGNSRLRVLNDGITTFGDLDVPLITLRETNSRIFADYTYESGQTLQGIGVAHYAHVAGAGVTIAPGVDGIGTLTFSSGSLDLSGGGNVTWQLGALADDVTGVAGSDFDLINAPSSTITLGGSSQLTLDFSLLGTAGPDSADSFWTEDHSWTVASSATGTTGNFASLVNSVFATGSFSTSLDGDNVVLSFSAVPEPSSVAMLAGLISMLAVGFRQRKP